MLICCGRSASVFRNSDHRPLPKHANYFQANSKPLFLGARLTYESALQTDGRPLIFASALSSRHTPAIILQDNFPAQSDMSMYEWSCARKLCPSVSQSSQSSIEQKGFVRVECRLRGSVTFFSRSQRVISDEENGCKSHKGHFYARESWHPRRRNLRTPKVVKYNASWMQIMSPFFIPGRIWRRNNGKW